MEISLPSVDLKSGYRLDLTCNLAHWLKNIEVPNDSFGVVLGFKIPEIGDVGILKEFVVSKDSTKEYLSELIRVEVARVVDQYESKMKAYAVFLESVKELGGVDPKAAKEAPKGSQENETEPLLAILKDRKKKFMVFTHVDNKFETSTLSNIFADTITYGYALSERHDIGMSVVLVFRRDDSWKPDEME